MNINQNLKNLYAAQQDLKSYNNYQNKTKKGEFVNEQLFNSADYNNDKKVNKNDLTKINNDIKNLEKSDKTYDLNNDGKLDIKDILAFEASADINGDGKVSDAEKNFLKEVKADMIKKMQDKKDNVEFDVNGDGKVDAKDVSAFLNLTGRNYDYRESNDSLDKYLTSFQNQLNYKVANLNGGSSINLEDLAVIDQRLEIANDIAKGDASAKWLSADYKKQSDVNGDGKVDQKDVQILTDMHASLCSQLGVTRTEMDKVRKDYSDAQAKEKQLTTETKNAETALKNAKTATSNAQKTVDTAQENKQAAQTAFDKASKEANNKLSALNTAKKTQDNAQKSYNAVTTNLTTAKNRLAEYKNKLKTAKGYDKELCQDAIKNIESDIKRLEKEQKTKKENLDKAKSKTKTAQSAYDKAAKAKTDAQTKLNNANTKLTNANNTLAAKKKAQMTDEIAYQNKQIQLIIARTNLKNAKTKNDKVLSYYTKAVSLNQEESKNQTNSYNSKLKTQQNELEKAQKNQKSAQTSFDKASKEVNNKLSALNTAKKTQDNAQKSYNAVTTNLKTAKNRLAEYKNKLKTAKGYDKELCQDAIKNIEADIKRLENEQKDKKKTLDSANSKVKTAQSNYDKAAKTKTDAQTKLDNAKKTATKEQQDVNNLKNSYNKTKKY